MFSISPKGFIPALLLVTLAVRPFGLLHGQIGPGQVGLRQTGVGQSGVGQFESGQIPSENLWRDPASLSFTDSRLVSSTNPLPKLLARGNAVDADLNAMAVLSADRLCAVGNCGVILLSKTAGRTWEVVECPTSDNLWGVSFLDSEQEGLAVGGSIGTYSGTSRGVVLRTVDGGRSWETVPNELPRLLGLQYAEGRLLAWGDYSPKFQTGIFESRDGGSTWLPISLPMAHAAAAALSREGEVVAADSQGQIHVLTSYGAVASSRLPIQIQALMHTGTMWLAGGVRGVLLSSQNGYQWAPVKLPLSVGSQRYCTWHTIQQSGNEIWIAGDPGTIVLHSPNRGASWEVKSTGQTGIIADIKFIDEQRGWAVGAQGKIWATRDGGQSWYSQRSADKHLGLLSVSHNASDLPWSPLVSASWDDRVAVGAVVMSASDEHDRVDFHPSQSEQLLDLAPQLSISCALAASFRQSASQDSVEDVARGLAVAIMNRRPEIILTGNASQDRLASDVDQKFPDLAMASRSAIVMAKDPAQSIPSLARELHLQPWSVSKLSSVSKSPTAGYREQSGRVLKSLGLAIWDVLLPLPPDVRQAAETADMRTLWSDTRNKSAEASLLGGLAIPDDARREANLSGLGNYQMVMGREYRQRALAQLASDAGTNGQWAQGLSFIISNLPPQEMAPALVQLIESLGTVESSERRRDALMHLVDFLPNSDAATWAMSKLLIEQASDELAAWRFADAHVGGAKPLKLPASERQLGSAWPADTRKPWNASPFASETISTPAVNEVVTASATAPARPVAHSPEPQAWFESFAKFSTLAPKLISRPDMQMLTYRMSQGGEGMREAARLESLLAVAQLPAWQQVAKQELLLHASRVAELDWIALAVRTYTRPRLDGHLDEAFWRQIPPMQLTAQQTREQELGQPSALVRWAYDSQYVYIGIQCPLEQAVTVPPVQRVRSYDADLSGLDNVTFLMDTDRDYSSCVEFAVSQDGRTYDRCLDRREFDPKWHVAVNDQQDTWTAELAIDLRFITTTKNLVGEAWAISAWRRRPGKSSQTWGRFAAGPPRLTDAGLLLFVPGRD